MTLLADGTTGVENSYDYNSAIRNRMSPVDDLGTQQNTYVAEVAQRRLVQKAADAEAALINAKGPDKSSSIVAPIQPNSPPSNSTSAKPTSVKGDNFASFKNAISSQESGGNYGAVNKSSGAMGKYQIMPSNIAGSGGWDKEALGYNINNAQFLASPQLQEKIATQKLQQYYTKYGAAGAAIAWYAGPGAVGKYNNAANAKQGSYPSINKYAQSILRKMGL